MLFRLAACLAFALGACSTQAPTQSGFLGGYDRLHAVAGKDGQLDYWKPGVDWGRYNNILIGRIDLRLPEAQKAELPDQERAAFLDTTTRLFEGAFARRFHRVTEPDENTLVVRAAITGIDRSSPGLNVFSAVVAFLPLDTGGATLEAELMDGATGETVASRIAAVNGQPFWFLESFESTGHAKEAIRRIAEGLAEDLVHQGEQHVSR